MTLANYLQTVVESSLLLPATRLQIFAQLLQWESYPHWNPYITRIDGEPRVGQPLTVYFSMGFGPSLSLHCQLLQVDPAAGIISWEFKAPLPGLYNAVHSFTVEEKDPHHCLLVQRERIQGLAATGLLGWFHYLLQTRFQRMHEALRDQLQRSAA